MIYNHDMIPLLAQHREAIAEFCQQYGLVKLEVFGSAAGDDFQQGQSDIDLFYEFDDNPQHLADRYFGLQEALEKLLQCEIDLVSAKDVSNPYFLEHANRQRVELYWSN